MKFKAYILNEVVRGRTQHIDTETAIKLTVQNCKNNFKKLYTNPNTLKIYRGLDFADSYAFIDTNIGMPRKSANTLNYMTLLMDNLPSWKGWPKRSRSIICSTEEDGAESYGVVYNVIPYDNSLIGICPTFDVWQSFYQIKSGVNSFNRSLQELFKNGNLLDDDENYSEFVNSLRELFKLYQDGDTANGYRFNNIRSIFDDCKGDIIDHFNKIFAPVYNDFTKGIDNLEDYKEVWIQGKCILFDNDFEEGRDILLNGIKDSL